jgi:hypothetical protein
MLHHYEVHGLHLVSELELKELRPANAVIADSQCDVSLELGPVPEKLEGGTGGFEGYEVAAEKILFSVPDVARYLAREGRTLVVDVAPGAEADAVRLFLLGSALGAILHQRGLVPLHASAVEFEGSCVAFVGDSGNGKSTTAALLERRGYRMSSDDVMVVGLTLSGEAITEPSAPVVKLWPASLALSGFSEQPAPFEYSQLEKHRINAASSFTDRRLPLRRVYVLAWQDSESTGLEFRELPPFEAMISVMKNVYRPVLVEALKREAELMGFATVLFSRIQVFEFRRTKDLGKIQSQIEMLEQHMRQG